MTTLNFQPLQHMRDLQDCDCKDSKTCKKCRLKKPGVYIWGFLYKKKSIVKDGGKLHELCGPKCLEKHNWEIVKFKDDEDDELKKAYIEIESASKNNEVCSNYLFIPYYVGISTDKDNGVKVRLNQHRELDEGSSKKQESTTKRYVRLKDEYMKCYHKHVLFLDQQTNPPSAIPEFPILKGTLNNNNVWTLLADQGYIYYFNRQSVCRLITHFDQKTNQKLLFQRPFRQKKEDEYYPIDIYCKNFGNNKWVSKNDPLKNRVKKEKDGKYNFWFTYCELDDKSLKNYIKSFKLPLILNKQKDLEKSEAESKKMKKLKEEEKRLNECLILIPGNESNKKNQKDLEDNFNKERKSFFEQAEAATYFLLKGITFSRTRNVENKRGWKIINHSGFDIFLNKNSRKTLSKGNSTVCHPSDQFNWPGYW
jgi:hypothetical protein